MVVNGINISSVTDELFHDVGGALYDGIVKWSLVEVIP